MAILALTLVGVNVSDAFYSSSKVIWWVLGLACLV